MAKATKTGTREADALRLKLVHLSDELSALHRKAQVVAMALTGLGAHANVNETTIDHVEPVAELAADVAIALKALAEST